jgi:hypothetical protein
MLGDKLLRRRNETLPPSVIEEILRKLTSELYFHGHPINAREANEDIGLTFVHEAPADLATKMWALYEIYNDDLHLDRPFEPTREAIAKNPLPVPSPPAGPVMPAGASQVMPAMPTGIQMPQPQALQQQTVQLDPLYFAIVEGYQRSEALRRNLEVTLLRDHLGNYQAGPPQVTEEGWIDCSAVPPVIDLDDAQAAPDVIGVDQASPSAVPEAT